MQLYYGARCIIAHGKPTKTMTEGSLRNFLTVNNLEDGLYNRRVAVEYRCLVVSNPYINLCWLSLCNALLGSVLVNTLFCKLSKNIRRIKAKIFNILLDDCGIKEAFCKLYSHRQVLKVEFYTCSCHHIKKSKKYCHCVMTRVCQQCY